MRSPWSSTGRGLRPTTTAGSGALVASGVFAGYGGTPVIRDVSLEVRPGQIVTLLGSNGAGKTTTLLTLAGELLPMRGTVSVGGHVTKAPLHRRARAGLAYVPEERSVFKSLTCRDNLRVGRSDLAKALELFPDLESRLGVAGGLLSGGEQQMLALGRALSGDPRVLLVDELSLGLAPLIVRRLLTTVRAVADRGAAVILVEQHVRQALKFADYVHVMQRGVLVLSGPAEEMRARIGEIEEMYLSGPKAL